MDLETIHELVTLQGDEWKKFLTENKAHMSRIDDDLSIISIKQNRPGMVDSKDRSEHYELFDQWSRHGLDESELKSFQTKAMTVGSDPDGGYFVPTEIDDEITALARNLSPMRQIARVLPVRTIDIKFLVSLSDSASGWVGETEARPVTNSGTLAAITPAFGEVYAEPKISQHLAEDAVVDMGAFLAEDIADKFDEQEGAGFLTGDGINKPRGLMTYDTNSTADATRDFGTIQYIASGAAGAFTTGVGSTDSLVNLVHAVKPKYRQNASWLMNSSTLGAVRKIRDAAGDPIFVQTITAGTPSMLFGYPVFEDENVADIAANSLSIAFGDFRKAYVICDRVGISTLRDPFTSKGNIIFYARKRVGGALVNSEAVKFMKFASS